MIEYNKYDLENRSYYQFDSLLFFSSSIKILYIYLIAGSWVQIPLMISPENESSTA